MKNLAFRMALLTALITSLSACNDNQQASQKQTSPQQVSAIDSADDAVINQATLIPNWAAISSWPASDSANETETITPVDPWQVTTIIVLDDSGSMANLIGQAKAAVIQAVSQFDPESRVGVVALNTGLVSPVVTAAEAVKLLPNQLINVVADGTTPLGSRLDEATKILAREAEKRRGFGVFRILVTTDGAASDNQLLKSVVSKILSKTPIELATIGIGIGEGHALNVPGFTSYVNVDSVEGLASALTAVAAEQTKFQPIDRFEE